MTEKNQSQVFTRRSIIPAVIAAPFAFKAGIAAVANPANMERNEAGFWVPRRAGLSDRVSGEIAARFGHSNWYSQAEAGLFFENDALKDPVIQARAKAASLGSGNLETALYAEGTRSSSVKPAFGETFGVTLYFKPGTDVHSLAGCDNGALAGDSHIRYGLWDLAFDPSILRYETTTLDPDGTNPLALDAQEMDNSYQGRIGWGFIGQFNVTGNPGSEIIPPCEMATLNTGNLLTAYFTVIGQPDGPTNNFIKQRGLADGFAFSVNDGMDTFYADAFKKIGHLGYDTEILRAGFETGDTSEFSYTVGGPE